MKYNILLLFFTVVLQATEDATIFFDGLPNDLKVMIQDEKITTEFQDGLGLPEKWTLFRKLRLQDARLAKFVPESTQIVIACKKNLYLYDLLSKDVVYLGLHPEDIIRLRFNNNNTLEVISSEGSHTLWNISEKRKENQYQHQEIGGSTFAMRRDGNQTAEIEDETLVIRNTSNGPNRFDSRSITFQSDISYVTYSSDNRTTAVGLGGGDVYVLDSEDPQLPSVSIMHHNAAVKSINFNHDTSMLVAVADDVIIWQESSNILSDYFKKSQNLTERYLFWAAVSYRNCLKQYHPERSSRMRIQDIVEFGTHAGPDRGITVEGLSEIAKKMPVNVMWALVRHFGIYDVSDKHMDSDLTPEFKSQVQPLGR